MTKTILLVWLVLAAICPILFCLWEIGKKIIKRPRKDKPKKSLPADDNSWRNDQHFDMH